MHESVADNTSDWITWASNRPKSLHPLQRAAHERGFVCGMVLMDSARQDRVGNHSSGGKNNLGLAIRRKNQEQVHGKDWRDLDALRAEPTTFFEITYNHQRLH